MAGNQVFGPEKPRKSFVLCFDGTGNKFNNTPADSNILKIFRMLDAGDPNYHVYYQPGIGTYVQSQSYSHTSFFTKTYSWVQKTRDSMIGSSFDQHLMAGYKFLMRYYQAGDDIYIFGFSRGSYTARFLAEMLDMVGLLPAGNEEMARFAFKSFARWQRRLDGTDEEKREKKRMFDFMTGFRETFSRPVRRIRFLGLFDTVNSVPRFEASFLRRSKFPYTAKSSAIVIRHAVAIDERRAKFRQDLIGETRRKSTKHANVNRGEGLAPDMKRVEKHSTAISAETRYRRKSISVGKARSPSRGPTRGRSPDTKPKPNPLLSGVREDHFGSHLDAGSVVGDASSIASSAPPIRPNYDPDDEDEDLPQDIQEVWFPGGHADIGGGWPLDDSETFPLSHTPLVWMVREAQKAGLRFVHEQMVKLKVIDDEPPTDARDYNYEPDPLDSTQPVPQLQISSPSPHRTSSAHLSRAQTADTDVLASLAGRPEAKHMRVDDTLAVAAEKGMLHDCLRFGQGTPLGGVLGWKVMEWMPFARMDLQPDNSWRAIRWPLPRGEVRDIPASAMIHTSALRRMEANPRYRPGNLIVGGGGRGVRVAPKEYGMGQWDVVREQGNPIGEVMVRRKVEEECANGEKNEEKNGGFGKRST